ncbi:MAG TPA: hypothetical protein VFZ34_04895 [Blastocatellia bacterium]|nr:hypothetical protein [Blastocatellia bacterium]
MNDNYLWDKSGEPDEEIQQLESLLSEFRYDPRPLVLPEVTPEVTRKAMIFSFVNLRYAALAAMVLLALGIGIWLSLRPATNTPDVAETHATPTPTVEKQVAPVPTPAPQPPAPQNAKQIQAPAPKAHFAKHTPKRTPRKSLQEEGEMAKEKVLYALQITSEKLNLIAKKVQTDTN